jgi:hypothetical protein
MEHHSTSPGSANPVTSKHTGKLNGAADFLKASYISRWCIVNTTKQQSIAEHMYRVWVLVRAWGSDCGLSTAEIQSAAELALTHDLAEIRLGDIPTPVKQNALIKAELDSMEEEIFVTLPVSPKVKQFVKGCDIAEAILFLKAHGVGRHAYEVRELLATQLWAKLDGAPFYQIFYDRFTDTFADT